jgi:branched-chain amino acid transport system permease protein
MLSFGHAVYSGLGAFFAIHAMNWVGAGTLPLPISMIPLVGASSARCSACCSAT